MSAFEVKSALFDEQARVCKGSGVIRPESSVFDEHFPGFPVLPGVLGIEILRKVVERAKNLNYVISSFGGVRFSDFLVPGDSWESELKLISDEQDILSLSGKIFKEGKAVLRAKLNLKPLIR